VALYTSSTGYFQQPYAGSGHTATLVSVSGTSSATDGDVQLSWWRGADGTFQGRTNAALSPNVYPSKIDGLPSFVDGGDFSGVLDITAFDAHDGDVLPVAAERGTDAVEPVTLHPQTVGNIYVSSFGDRTSQGTPAILQVVDTDGAPIAGAEVRRSADQSLVGYTDVAGHVSALQQAGSVGEYYVNATDADAYDAADGDFSTTTDPTPDYAPQATSTVAQLADGDVFDADEYTLGDLALQVVDQQGTPYGPAARPAVTYSVHRTGTEPTGYVTATPDAAGRVVIPFDASQPGTYTIDYGTPEGAPQAEQLSTTFTVGDSTLSLSPGVASARSGGSITYTGSLAVRGKPMPGRTIDLRYSRGTELAPGTGADAGFGAGHALTATAVTDADGAFTVTVQDPAESGSPTETGGRLTATTANTTASGDSTLAGNAAESTTAAAEFGSGKGHATVHLSGRGRKARADRLTVQASAGVAGARVVVYRQGRHHEWLRVAGADLDARNLATFTVTDRNGTRATRYRVTLRGTSRLQGTTSNTLRLS
jgi:hypothetical protein